MHDLPKLDPMHGGWRCSLIFLIIKATSKAIIIGLYIFSYICFSCVNVKHPKATSVYTCIYLYGGDDSQVELY